MRNVSLNRGVAKNPSDIIWVQCCTCKININLTMRQHGVRGYLLVLAELASKPQFFQGTDFRTSHIMSRVSASLMVEPASLARFADELATIPKGADVNAYLHGGDVT